MKRVLVIVLLALAGGSCGSSGGGGKKDGGVDGGGGGACLAAGAPRKISGEPCACKSDCATGFCVDGVCCSSACAETCKACDVQGSVGTCTFVASGIAPRVAATCPKSNISTCGLDGTCDGKGACAKFPAGTVCTPGTCAGASVGGEDLCDGQGRCRPGPTTVCVPFGCNTTTNACYATCSGDTDCVAGVKCVNGSCGPKPPGAVCTRDGECASGFCTDGVCCNVACRGACVTCNQPGRLGTCWPTEIGRQDPHHICTDQGAASCGRTGTCDGLGGCARYAPETVCVAPSCSGDRLNTAGTCDGLGSCHPPRVQDCSPYRCLDGACVNRCTSDAQCIAGHACMNGSCGKKMDGQSCADAGECVNGFCVDGVCCAEACPGACMSCGLLSALGRCTPVPAGADDPRNICTNQGPASCGTDKKCDGAGACRKYKVGTVCAAEKCDSNVYTPEAICDATGKCVAPDAIACPPYACNGSRCFGTCTNDTNCASGNVCIASSCGKKPIGAFCGDKSECASGNCAQGVCCTTGCASACKSCALSGTMGQCTNVPKDGPDPTETCADQSSKACGTTGKCEAGACQRYAQGIPCKDASCPSNGMTFTPGSTCDGAGTCVTPASSSCFPFACGTNACKSTCTSDADCASPASCNGGSCGLKPLGAACAAAAECGSSTCAQGVCCNNNCDQTCRSCTVTGKVGTCSPVLAGGTDLSGTCKDQGATTCGQTGFCDGASACQLYAAGVLCAGPTCPAGGVTGTLARTCDGGGACKTATTQSCGVYACNGATCNAACGMDGDCAPGNFCEAGSCGLKRLGQLCVMGNECDSGNCVDGVCCSAPTCGTCQACNVAGNAGTCHAVPAEATEPHNRCVAVPPCGLDGKCDGLGACRNALAGGSCGAASCTGTTFTPVGSCDGDGACKQPSSSCAPYICGAGACLTTCVAGGCAPGFACLSGSCTNLKPDGSTCTADVECISTHCSDGVCCNLACTGACVACNQVGMGGTCLPTSAGTNPRSACPTETPQSCGSTGSCDGAGACQLHPTGTVCAAASCPSGSSTATTASKCDGNGLCVAGVTQPCAPYLCDDVAGTCRMSCTVPGDCAPPADCVSGVCQ